MFGWRARLGLLVPMDNAVIEPEYARAVPDGVEAFTVRLTTVQRPAMPRNGVELSACFAELGVDVIGYACAETSFLEGADANTWISEGVTAATGRPAVTASTAMTEALDALGVRRVAIASPYPSASTDALVGFLEAGGRTVVRVVSCDLVSAAGGVREWDLTNRQPPGTAVRLAREADHPDADAVVISATNLRTLEVVGALERDLGKPVVSSNTALLWALLRRAHVDVALPVLGGLGTRADAPRTDQ